MVNILKDYKKICLPKHFTNVWADIHILVAGAGFEPTTFGL